MDESLIPLRLVANAIEINLQLIAKKIVSETLSQSGLCRQDHVHFRNDFYLYSIKACEIIRNALVGYILV